MVAVYVPSANFGLFQRPEAFVDFSREREISLLALAATIVERANGCIKHGNSVLNTQMFASNGAKTAPFINANGFHPKRCGFREELVSNGSCGCGLNGKINKQISRQKQTLLRDYRVIIRSRVKWDTHVDVTYVPRPMYGVICGELVNRCKKGELFDYLTEVVTLSEKRTRQIMRQLLEAVVYIHEKNIVHRDLKPENILLDDSMNVKLSDFGFATVISHDKELQDLCGTPGYLAPEVLKVSMYDEADGYGKPVDMWACGVIMYTLLVGCPPFWHRKQMYMLRAIMDGRYSFGSPEWDDVSDLPKQLISQLLVVEPKSRLTAQEALQHPFFKREERPEEKREFFARRMFRAAVLTVTAVHRIRNLHLNPPPISKQAVRRDPYSTRIFRKAIDAGAFKIYGHWVKRGENQNRAALFENTPKRDLKVAALNGGTNKTEPYIQT